MNGSNRLREAAQTEPRPLRTDLRIYILEIEMDTKHLLGSAGLICAVVAAGPAFAEAGIRDGADHFSNLELTRTRADVHREFIDSKGEGTSVSMRDGDEERNLGAYGVAGSRYSRLTRAEVQSELAQSRGPTPGDRTGSIYFGD